MKLVYSQILDEDDSWSFREAESRHCSDARTLGGVSDHTTGESLLGSFRLRAFNLSSI
jgi:hypothetical protein